MTDHPEMDPFWVENRAKFLAEKSTSADPSACGTCRSLAEAGKPVKHDGCAQRATLLHAPDHPYYEILAGFSLEENEKLPARFHVPVFDDCGVPNSWLCAVCQEEGQVVGWPCATATKYGTQVFTPLHEAETAQKKQQAEAAELQAENARLREELTEAARVSESLYRRLTQEQLAGSALYAALTMPTTPEQRQAALDKFQAVAQQVTPTPNPTTEETS